jgi:hypothetical protein
MIRWLYAGIVNSLGMFIAGRSALFTGWIIDRVSPKEDLPHQHRVFCPSPASCRGFIHRRSYRRRHRKGIGPLRANGRWVGITRFFKTSLDAFMAIDILIRMPLLISIPKTLHTRFKSEADT